MATLKIQTCVLIRNCPKTDIPSLIFMIYPAGTKMIVYMQSLFSPMTFWWESPSHINNHLCSCKSYHDNEWWNISFRANLKKNHQLWIFRVAIFMVIWQILNWMGNLIKKGPPDLSYLCLKSFESVFFFSGFPKKACQGYHIFWSPGKILM